MKTIERLAIAAKTLAPKHFRWISRAALDHARDDLRAAEDSLVRASALVALHASGDASAMDRTRSEPMTRTAMVAEAMEACAEREKIVAFVAALDEVVQEVGVTASVRGVTVALAKLTDMMRGKA